MVTCAQGRLTQEDGKLKSNLSCTSQVLSYKASFRGLREKLGKVIQ